MNFEKMEKSSLGETARISIPDFRQVKINHTKKIVSVSAGFNGKYEQFVDKENKIIKFIKVADSKSTSIAAKNYPKPSKSLNRS